MKNWYRGLGLILLVVALVGCANGAAAPVSAVTGNETYVSIVLGTDHADALTVRNQLALGMLNLEGTVNEITPEQAKSLLLLWQALAGTTRSGASATAEVDALLTQIEETLTPSQLEVISAMHLTQYDLRAWAESQGLTLGTGEGAGSGMGSGRGLSEEERAARQAENGGTGAGGSRGLSTALLEAVVTFLEVRQ